VAQVAYLSDYNHHAQDHATQSRMVISCLCYVSAPKCSSITSTFQLAQRRRFT